MSEQELPPTWATGPLGKLAKAQKGKLPKAFANEPRAGYLPYIDIKAFEKNQIERYALVEEATCSYETDVFVVWDGARFGLCGKGQKGVLGSTLVRVTSDAVIPDYLYYFILSKYRLIQSKPRGTGTPHVEPNLFWDLDLPVAPSKEQARIVSKIDELFSEIEDGERALERVQKLVRRYRESVLNAAVTGELTRTWRERHQGKRESGGALLARTLTARRDAWEKAELGKMKAKGIEPSNDQWKAQYRDPPPTDATSLPRLPEGWVWARAEQLCAHITKGTTPSASKMTQGDGEVPYLKVYNLTFDGSLDFTKDPTFVKSEVHEGELARSRLFPGDVVMNIVGPPLGKVSLIPDAFAEWNMNQAIAVFRVFSGFDRRYLVFYLLSRVAQDWYMPKAKATSGQFNLTLEICRDTPIPVPPPEEQMEIVQLITLELSRLDALTETIGRESLRGSALRRCVLASAFNGALIRHDESDEPASRLLERIAAGRGAENAIQERSRKGRGAE